MLVTQIRNSELNQLRKLCWFETDIGTLREILELVRCSPFSHNLKYGTFIALRDEDSVRDIQSLRDVRAVFCIGEIFVLCRNLFV